MILCQTLDTELNGVSTSWPFTSVSKSIYCELLHFMKQIKCKIHTTKTKSMLWSLLNGHISSILIHTNRRWMMQRGSGDVCFCVHLFTFWNICNAQANQYSPIHINTACRFSNVGLFVGSSPCNKTSNQERKDLHSESARLWKSRYELLPNHGKIPALP